MKKKQTSDSPIYDRYGDYEEKSTDVDRATLFRVDPLELEKTASIQPELLNFIGVNLARAKEKYEDAQVGLKVAKAQTWLKFKDFGGGGKGPTVAELESRVQSDIDVLEATAKVIETKKMVDLIEADFNAALSKDRMIQFFKREYERSLQYK